MNLLYVPTELLFTDVDDNDNEIEASWRGLARNLRWLVFSTNWLSVGAGIVRLVTFEWTSGYGLYPARPLQILAALILIFAVIYWFPISFITQSQSGIFRIWSKERIGITRSGLGFLEAKVERLNGGLIIGLLFGLQFSVLSAFQIGFREFNVGNWLTRLQAKEYGLVGRGWVRSIAGAQSIVSLYLLALSILTYFGRPF